MLESLVYYLKDTPPPLFQPHMLVTSVPSPPVPVGSYR